MEILVQRFARIFFEVGARQVDGFFVGLVTAADLHRQRATLHHGQIELTDLVAFGQVRVKVVLACKNRFRSDLRINGQTKADRTFDSLPVEYRQHAGKGEIDGAGLGIGLGAEGGGSAGEYLRDCRQLCVRLDADDNFPLFHGFIRSMTAPGPGVDDDRP